MSICTDAGRSHSVGRFPSLVDCHVHFREPGLTHKADMQSEGQAALAGGVSIVCDMPNTSPATQTIEALRDKVNRAKDHCPCRIYFFFGATALTHLDELVALWTQREHEDLKQHCCGLKLYLDNSTGDMKASDQVTNKAFEICGRLDIPLVAHCEHADLNAEAAAAHPYTNPFSHSLRRPPSSEVKSILEAVTLAKKFQTPLHIAHLSTADGLEAVKAARKECPSLRLTCEVTPHHLFLTVEDYGCCGTRIKVNPPIRDAAHAEALWSGLLEGHIDCIATDHAPHTREEKGLTHNTAGGGCTSCHTTDIIATQPPSGMPGVELVVPLLLTVMGGKWPHPTAAVPVALSAYGVTSWAAGERRSKSKSAATARVLQELLLRTMHTNPVRIFRLSVDSQPSQSFAFNFMEEWCVEESLLRSKCGWSPYQGWKLLGKVDHSEQA